MLEAPVRLPSCWGAALGKAPARTDGSGEPGQRVTEGGGLAAPAELPPRPGQRGFGELAVLLVAARLEAALPASKMRREARGHQKGRPRVCPARGALSAPARGHPAPGAELRR